MSEQDDFQRFFTRNVERARRLAWRLVGGDGAAAADVVQESFIKAYRGLARFRGEARLDTWFFRIVVNEAANHGRRPWIRRWRRGAPVVDELARAVQPPGGDSALRRRIATAIGNLSTSQRQAFVLVHLEQHTVREAAELMDVAEGTVKQHLHRALVRLRGDLADLQGEARGNEQMR